ncbi:MAG TPA: hypothetical protein VGD60_05030 [Candidatus Acidoferrales bacterium]
MATGKRKKATITTSTKKKLHKGKKLEDSKAPLVFRFGLAAVKT